MLTEVNCLDHGNKIKFYPNVQKVTAYNIYKRDEL